MFSAAHLHIATNHLPVVGFMAAFALAVFGLFIRDRMLHMTAWAFTLASALAAVFAYFTGGKADDMMMDASGISNAYMSAHMRWGEWTYYAGMGVGVLAIIGWIMAKKSVKPGAAGMVLLVVLTLVANIMAVITASLGGGIRHLEMHNDGFEAIIRKVGMIPDERDMYKDDPKWTAPPPESDDADKGGSADAETDKD